MSSFSIRDRANGGKVRRFSTEPATRHRLYADAVRQAIAQARLAAEIKAFQDDPVTWQKQGPGKETPESPGWTTTVKPIIREGNQTINVLLSPEMQGVFAAILQVLAPFPEARAAAARALAGEKTARLEVK
jgi:hypothetical protein